MSVLENVTTAAPEKRAGDTSPAVGTGTRIITESVAASVIAIANGTVTATGKESGRGNIATVSQEGR